MEPLLSLRMRKRRENSSDEGQRQPGLLQLLLRRNDPELNPLFFSNQTLRSQLTLSAKGREDGLGPTGNMKRADRRVIQSSARLQMENKSPVLFLGSIDAINLRH